MTPQSPTFAVNSQSIDSSGRQNEIPALPTPARISGITFENRSHPSEGLDAPHWSARFGAQFRLLSIGVVVFYFLPSSMFNLSAAEPKNLTISGNDTMKFDITEFEVSPGQTVKLTLINSGKLPKSAMGHNFVLLRSGTDLSEFSAAGASHPENSYIASEFSSKVLARTILLGPGESDTITFVAPSAGVYPFLCTFPGHCVVGMRGTMTVR